ncbi:MAG: TonB-dependent receptor [Bacteroidia bacterium]|nr:TonB-dependent receptor [Bacteroidia bacterium]
MEEVLRDLEKQSGAHFAYSPEFISGMYVSLHLENQPLDTVIHRMLSNTNVCVRESENLHYLLFRCSIKQWKLKGTVYDQETGETLPFADVSLGNHRGTVANNGGQFSFFNVTEDTVRVRVYYIGYQPREVMVTQNTGEVDVSLDRTSTVLKGTQVDVYTEFLKTGKFYSQLSINTDLVKGFPTLGEPDPIKSIKLLPGVGGNAETSTGIAMRGGKFDQTMIMFDDFQLLHVDHFFGLFSAVNQNMVKDIQVYRSGYSSKYSGFTSGLIRITAKDGNRKRVSGGFSTNMYSSSAYLEVPILKNRWSTALSFRTDNAWVNHEFWTDAIVLPHIENEIRVKSPSAANAEDTEGSIDFYDLTFKTRYQLSDRHNISISYFNSHDRVETLYNNAVSDEEDVISQLDLTSFWRNGGASIKWEHQIKENYKAELIYTRSRFNNVSRFNHILEVIEDDTLENIQDLGVTNRFTQEHYRYDIEINRPKSNWFLGADVTVFESRFNSVEEDEEFTDNFRKNLPAVYAENRRTLSSKLEILYGSRFTYEDEDAQLFVEPRVSAFYKFGKRLKSTVSYGLYYQHAKQYVPDQREGLVPDYWLLPDYELTFPTRAHIASIGLSYTKARWLVNAEVFYKDVSDMAEQFPSISDLFESNADFVKVLSSGTSRVLGGDLVVRKEYKKSSIWVGLGLNQVRNGSDSIRQSGYQPYYTNLGDVKLGYVYRWKKWEAGLNWVWLGGRKYTHVDNDLQLLSDVEIGNDLLPDYHRLDASLAYKLTIKKLNGALRANLFNVYNRRNTRTINFTHLESAPTTQPQAISVATLGFRPNLTLEVNF